MLLLIDTSGDNALVMLSAGGKIACSAQNDIARDHSAWLHPAIQRLLAENNQAPRDLQAVAVTAGPGSYTGLRVGMAAAKGICFAMKIPLITCNNLLLMAMSMVPLSPAGDLLLCPMIDARRMEVFTALYTSNLDTVISGRPMILDKTSFEAVLASETILFSGSGAAKWQEICNSPSARFISQQSVKEAFVNLATRYFDQAAWADTVYSEPDYGKEFHTHVEI